MKSGNVRFFAQGIVAAVVVGFAAFLLPPAPAASAAESFGNALRLDGSGDYANVASNAGLQLGDAADEDFTIEASIYVPDLTQNTVRYIAFKPLSYALGVAYSNTDDDQLVFNVWTPGQVDTRADVNLSVGWHHVAAVFTNNLDTTPDSMALYLDGSKVADQAKGPYEPGITTSDEDLAIGGWYASQTWDGWIDEVRISDTARYSGDYTVPTAAFTIDSTTRALWHFDESVCATTFADASGNGNDLTAQDNAVAALPGAPAPTVQFSAADYSVDEPDGSATITVNRSGDAAQVISLPYDTHDGTAVAGADYTATSGTLRFACGDLSRTFDVPVTNDAEVEGDEALALSLAEPTGARLGAQAAATLTIHSDDLGPAIVAFAPRKSWDLSEGVGTYNLVVRRNGNTSVTASADYVIDSGTASADDYTLSSGTVTFAPGETSKTIPIPINDDSQAERPETFGLRLESPGPDTRIGSLDTVELTIDGNDFALQALQDTATIIADIHDNWLHIGGLSPDSPYSVVVQAADTTVVHSASYASDSGGYLDTGVPVDLVPGMTVTLTDDTTAESTSFTFANLAITWVNAATDTVTGTADPLATVTLSTNNPNASGFSTVADGNGNWSYTFPDPDPDLTLTSAVVAEVPDPGTNNRTSYTGRSPSFRADLASGWIGGENFSPNATVSVQVWDSEGGTSLFVGQSDTDGTGWFQTDTSWQGVFLAAGMYVSVTDGVHSFTTSLTLANLTIDSINVQDDTVSGTADVGSRIELGSDNPPYGASVDATDGTWSLAFPVDLTRASMINAQINDPLTGNRTGLNRGSPTFRANLYSSWIDGNGFSPNSTVTVIVRQSAGGDELWSGDFSTDPAGSFGGDIAQDMTFATGMFVRVIDNGGSASGWLTLAYLTVDGVDLDTETVSGRADPLAQINLNSPNTWGTTSADENGDWSYTFTNDDLTATSNIEASVVDPVTANRTSVNWAPPTFRADLGSSSVCGNGFTRNSTVTVVVEQSPGGATLATVGSNTDGAGNFCADTTVTHAPGMAVTVTDDSSAFTTTLTLVDLAIDNLDLDLNQISGHTEPDARVQVHTSWPETWQYFADADAGGNWSVTFTEDLTPLSTFDLWVTDSASGNSTGLYAASPTFRADLEMSNVSGSGFTPNTPVHVVVEDAGTQVATDDAVTDPSGNFWVGLWNWDGALAPGMVVTVTDDAGLSTSLTLANLTIDAIDVQNNTVSGTADVGSKVDLGSNNPESWDYQAVADENGDWSNAFNEDLTALSNVDASILDEQTGNRTGLNKSLPSFRAMLDSGWIEGSNFTPGSTVTVEVWDSEGGNSLFTGESQVGPRGETWAETGLIFEPDMVVSITDPALAYTTTLTLANLYVDRVHGETDTVTGSAGPYAMVEVQTYGPDDWWSTQANGKGFWSATFQADLTPGTGIEAWVVDQTTNNRTGRWGFSPWFRAYLGTGQISLNNFTPDSTVTVVVQDAQGSEIFRGGFMARAAGPGGGADTGIALEPGMVVTATDEATAYTTSLTLATLAITDVDPATGTVSGTAEPGSALQVETGMDNAPVLADDAGLWSHTFGDIPSHWWVDASVVDSPSGNQTAVHSEPPSFTAQLRSNQLYGQYFTPNATVAVEILDSEGGNQLFSDTLQTDWRGEFGMPPEATVHFMPGMFVSVTDVSTSLTTTLTLAYLTVDAIDVEYNTVTGHADPGTGLTLIVSNPDGWGEPLADADGLWVATQLGVDLTESSSVLAETADQATGNRTQAHFAFPSFSVTLGSASVDGVDFTPDSTATVVVDGAPAGVANIDDVGSFSFDTSMPLTSGMVVSITDDWTQRTYTLTVAALSIGSVDVENAVVTGTAPPGAVVNVQRSDTPNKAGQVQADAQGVWTIQPGESIAGIGFTVWVTDASRNTTRVVIVAGTVTPVQFSVGEYVVDEASGVATLTVTRTGDVVAWPASVDYATADGTATAGVDYAARSGTLEFPGGVTSQEVTIPITNDPLDEPDETFQVSLSSPGSGTELGAPTVATVTITDNDAPAVVAFQTGSSTVSEADGTVQVSVIRSGNTASPAGVTVGYSGGNASWGADFTFGAVHLHFSPGITSRTVALPILEDAIDEPDEDVQLTLSGPDDGSSLGTLTSTTVTITDNDAPAVVAFATGSRTVKENVGTVSVPVGRTGNTGVRSTVYCHLGGGTAAVAGDLTFTATTLVFGPGDLTEKYCQAVITNDTASEGPETFTLVLSNPSAGTEVTGLQTTTVTISASDQWPDGQISTASTTGYIGNNVYNTTGTNQTKTQNARRGETRTFYVRVYNDGNVANGFTIKGAAAPSGASVKYYSGSADITAAMRSSVGWKKTIAAGSYAQITVKITLLSGAAIGSTKSVTVTGSWSGDRPLSDTVKASVKVIR